MDKTIAGHTVDVTAEGYLTDMNQWNKEIAQEIANQEDVGALTDKHLAILEYLREQQANKVALTIRKVGKSGVTDIKELYALFPGGPLKKATKIAGIPKPVGCI